MSETYKPGDVVAATVEGRPNVRLVAGWSKYDPQLRWCELSPRWANGDDDWCWFFPHQVSDIRRLVVLDPEDRTDAKRIVTRLVSETRLVLPGSASEWDAGVQAALRALVTPPKPYREHSKALPPWPEVGECHSRHIEGHECPQCAWEHEHDWVAWTHPDAIDYGVPIRCSKCGGRKCDRDDCDQQRHTHTHAEGVQP